MVNLIRYVYSCIVYVYFLGQNDGSELSTQPTSSVGTCDSGFTDYYIGTNKQNVSFDSNRVQINIESNKSESLRKYAIGTFSTDSGSSRSMSKLSKAHNHDLINTCSPSTSSSHSENWLSNSVDSSTNHEHGIQDDNDTDDEKAASMNELPEFFKLNWSQSPEMQKSINWVR